MSNEDKDVFQREITFTVDPWNAEKRLVIEQIGAWANPPPGQKMHFYLVSTTVRGAFARYFFDPANNPKFSSTHRVRIYADPQYTT